MAKVRVNHSCLPRLSTLAIGLAGALAAADSPVSASSLGDSLVVTSCADDGSAGTLRSVVASAPSPATVDLTSLACGTITLAQGEIAFTDKNLTLIGPGRDRLAIDGNDESRIFNGGIVTVEGLTLMNGHAAGRGGCIYSSFEVTVRASRVTDCRAEGDSAQGGGVYGMYQVHVEDSVISSNTAIASTGYAIGGGIASRYETATIERSTISGNSAIGNPGLGGGIYALGFTSADHSTIEGNSADRGGGIYCTKSFLSSGTCRLDNSTLSGNTAHDSGGAVLADSADLSFMSSTIAFNVAENGDTGGVLLRRHSLAIGSSTIQSSIITNNVSSGTLAPDLDTDGDPMIVGGPANLLTSQGRVTLLAVIADPGLLPLADNGGPTLTHALPSDSAAVDTGFATADNTDQRGRARVSGAAADVGAYELQIDVMFANSFDPD
jgi:predicted outer membrane repeat protein